MPLYYLSSNMATREVQSLATTFPNPKGRPWSAKTAPTIDRNSFKLRAYDPITRNDHQCWVNFSIQAQGEEAATIEAAICNHIHHSAKVRKHVLEAMHKRYGRPT